jgi:hypothetical protein
MGEETSKSLTYLLTPWSRVLLEKLTGSAASQEIPHIFGTRRFIAVLTMPATTRKSHKNKIRRISLKGSRADGHFKIQSFTDVSVSELRSHLAGALVES